METIKKTNKPREDEVLREFPAIGKYRVRLLKRPRKGTPVLDLREYVSAESFEGFTRRGVSFGHRAELEQLLAVLRETVDANMIGESS